MSDTWTHAHNAVGRWAWAYDESDLEMFADSVTADARVTIETGNGPVEVLRGRDTIRSFFGDRLLARPAGLPRRHVTTLVTIDEGEREATVLSYLTLYTFVDRAPQLVTTGWYRDRIVDEGDMWRIADRHVHLDVAELPEPY
ncbi:MAG TPA: nuclear transport factor 2 family protein [Galbitalea sp.]|nr:nuclear transport factor 2 family protein [Galbitalea sp.]